MNDKIVGRPIRLNRRMLKAPRGYADLLLVGDLHYGSPQCDIRRFEDNLAFCLKTRTYVLLMGDLLEMSTRTSIGAGIYEQEEKAEDQFDFVVSKLTPLSQAGLLAGLYRGNHEIRVFEATGIDISKALARSLNVPYLGDACWNRFRVGKQYYTIYGLHGRTAAQYDGTVLKSVENISHSFVADAVIMGHAHKTVDGIMLMQEVRNGLVVERKKFLVVTGSYLKYDGGYYAQRGGRLSKLGSPRLRLYANRHDISVSW